MCLNVDSTVSTFCSNVDIYSESTSCGEKLPVELLTALISRLNITGILIGL